MAWGDDNIQTGRGGRSPMRGTEDYTVYCVFVGGSFLIDLYGLLGLIL